MTWLDHTLGRIAAAQVTAEPWPLLIVPDVFPAELFARLLAERRRAVLQPLNPDNHARKLMWLGRPGLPAFWHDFGGVLLSPRLSDVLRWTFGLDYSPALTVAAQLVHDDPGYELGPHTDMPPKILTGLFYLPDDAGGAEHGTAIYRSRSGVEDDGTRDFPFSDDFELQFTVPFMPNTALFFPCTGRSFHAVRKTPVERWLIAYDMNLPTGA